MRTHILTLNWNGAKYLKPLYDSFSGGLDPYSNTWYVRDNGSKDNSLQVLRDLDGRVPIQTFDVGHNRDSFAACTNWLFEKAAPKDEDFLLLLNNDVKFSSALPMVRMKRLMQETDAGVVGMRLLYMGTNKLQHAGVIFSEQYNQMPYHYRPGEESDKNAEKNRYFQAVTAAVCLIKASSWRRVGGMDERFRWAFEDVDLCLRIGQEEKIVYCGEAFAYHEESASLKKNPVNKMFMGKNAQYFKKKWLGKYEIDHDKYLSNPAHNEIE
jgi:GT2 family glycosyltransferase